MKKNFEYFIPVLIIFIALNSYAQVPPKFNAITAYQKMVSSNIVINHSTVLNSNSILAPGSTTLNLSDKNFIITAVSASSSLVLLIGSQQNLSVARNASQVGLIAAGNYLANPGTDASLSDINMVKAWGTSMQTFLNTGSFVIKNAGVSNLGIPMDFIVLSSTGSAAFYYSSNANYYSSSTTSKYKDLAGTKATSDYSVADIQEILSQNKSEPALEPGTFFTLKSNTRSQLGFTGVGSCTRGCQVFGAEVSFIPPGAVGTIGDVFSDAKPSKTRLID